MLRPSLLGMFRIERDGRLIPDAAWSRPKAKKLLKLLALCADHQLHREQTTDWLWLRSARGLSRRRSRPRGKRKDR